MMSSSKGASQANGLGGPEGLEPHSRLHPADAIPSAAEGRILAAVKRALRPLDSPGMTWPEYYRRLQQMPGAVLDAIRDAQVLFRLPEQADWPLIIEAFRKRPYALTIRTQMTIGGQTFGIDSEQSDMALYTALPRDLAMHMSRHAIRATLEAVAMPFYEQAAIQFASAIEARRAETAETGSVADESAVPEADAQPQPGPSQ